MNKQEFILKYADLYQADSEDSFIQDLDSLLESENKELKDILYHKSRSYDELLQRTMFR